MGWLKGALFGHKVFKWWRRNEVGKRILGKELTSEQIEYDVTEKQMKALIGALKSKTMWFGLLQAMAGAAAVFLDTNIVPAVEGDQSALLVTGVLTWVLRAVTNKGLSDK